MAFGGTKRENFGFLQEGVSSLWRTLWGQLLRALSRNSAGGRALKKCAWWRAAFPKLQRWVDTVCTSLCAGAWRVCELDFNRGVSA